MSDAIKNLKNPEYEETDPLANNISHPIFKAILKYRNHPSIVAMKNLNKDSRFDFYRVSVQDVVKEIKKLSTRKATQSSCQNSKRKLRCFWKLCLRFFQ